MIKANGSTEKTQMDKMMRQNTVAQKNEKDRIATEKERMATLAQENQNFMSEMEHAFGAKMQAMNFKLDRNKKQLITNFVNVQEVERLAAHTKMRQEVQMADVENLLEGDDELEQMIINEQKEETMKNLMEDDNRIDMHESESEAESVSVEPEIDNEPTQVIP